MKFLRMKLKEEFNIEAIISLHYFEFARDYKFVGESHDFWEFLYVDKGEVEVAAGRNGYVLKQGDIIFHKPGEFHNVWANHRIAPNIVVVSFACRSEAMGFFENRIFTVGDNERNMISSLISEGMDAFSPPFDDPAANALMRRPDAGFGSEQMVKICLQRLLISFVRRNIPADADRKLPADADRKLPVGINTPAVGADALHKGGEKLSSAARERAEKDVAAKTVKYFEQNICSKLTLSDVCGKLNMSRTHLAEVFRRNTGMGVMEYYKKMKIEKAKQLIREEDHNFTEISDILGYESIHSFSRHFKSVTDMSPSEYSKSVKSRVET